MAAEQMSRMGATEVAGWRRGWNGLGAKAVWRRGRVGAIAMAVVIACLAGTGTFAYFSASSVSASTITAGRIGVALAEYQRGSGGELEPFTGAGRVVPGESVSMVPVVTNTEDKDCWVRASVVTSVVLADGTTGDVSVIVPGFDQSAWTYRDGYWYCGQKLAAHEEASALFEELAFDAAAGGEYAGATFSIAIRAQAVQADNNGSTALEATGWPAT